jgi:hypothetical protein
MLAQQRLYPAAWRANAEGVPKRCRLAPKRPQLPPIGEPCGLISTVGPKATLGCRGLARPAALSHSAAVYGPFKAHPLARTLFSRHRRPTRAARPEIPSHFGRRLAYAPAGLVEIAQEALEPAFSLGARPSPPQSPLPRRACGRVSKYPAIGALISES